MPPDHNTISISGRKARIEHFVGISLGNRISRNSPATVLQPGVWRKDRSSKLKKGGAMSKVIEREQSAEDDHSTTVEDHELPPLETIERPVEFTPTPAAPKPSTFVRWMGWLLGAVILVGGAGLIWWAASQGDDVSTPPEVAPEVTGVDPLSLESLALLRSLPVMIPAEVAGVDPLSLESLRLLRSLPTQGIDELSLESLALLRSLPVMIPAEID
jgi:hypothetical protein